MKRRFAGLLLIVPIMAGVVLRAAPAYGCSCAETTLEDAIGPGTAAAFIGRPVSVTEVQWDREADVWVEPLQWTFDVEIVLAGELPERIVVGTGYGGGDCGYDFSRTGRIGVVTYGEPGNLSTNMCGGVWDAEELLAAHGPGVAPIPIVPDSPPGELGGTPLWMWWAAGGVAALGATATLLLVRRRPRDYQDGWVQPGPMA